MHRLHLPCLKRLLHLRDLSKTLTLPPAAVAVLTRVLPCAQLGAGAGLCVCACAGSGARRCPFSGCNHSPLRPRNRPLLGPSNPLRPSRSRSAPNLSSCPRSISKLTSRLRTCCNFRNLASQPCNFASIGGTQLCTARFLANVQPEGSVSNTSRTRTKPARAVTSFSSLRKFALPHGNLCQTQTLLNYPRVKVQGQGWVPDHCWAGGFKVANGPASKQNVSSPRVNDFFTRFRGESWGTLKDLPP